jgi:hypothetical protein
MRGSPPEEVREPTPRLARVSIGFLGAAALVSGIGAAALASTWFAFIVGRSNSLSIATLIATFLLAGTAVLVGFAGLQWKGVDPESSQWPSFVGLFLGASVFVCVCVGIGILANSD